MEPNRNEEVINPMDWLDDALSQFTPDGERIHDKGEKLPFELFDPYHRCKLNKFNSCIEEGGKFQDGRSFNYCD